MVKNLVTAAHWNTSNVNIYHQSWTTDKQNRFFSLEAWGPIDSNPQFTAKFLGRPVNIAFKSKHRATGKEEPCLCFLFAPDLTHPTGVARLVQPCNFVTVNTFDGYDPIEESVIKKFKSKKDLAIGTWYKKVWSMYCAAVVPDEYKQPAPPGPVKVVEAKKKSNEKNNSTQKKLDDVFSKVSKNSTFSGDEDGDAGGAGDEENSETTESNVDVVARATVGGKSPRHLATLQAAEKYFRERMVRDGQKDKNLRKESKVNAANKRQAKIQDPNFDSDNDSLPDVSSASEFTEDTEFEDEVVAYAFRRYHEWHGTYDKKDKATKKQQSEGSVSGSSGTYELC